MTNLKLTEPEAEALYNLLCAYLGTEMVQEDLPLLSIVRDKLAGTRCPECGGQFTTTKNGTMRYHLGRTYDGRWRQVCAGVGRPPVPETSPRSTP